MMTYSIQHKIRHGGAWAKADGKTDVAHFFSSSTQSNNVMIAVCWGRIGQLDTAVEADHAHKCLACQIITSMQGDDLSNKT
jgi:hypothetical protein